MKVLSNYKKWTKKISKSDTATYSNSSSASDNSNTLSSRPANELSLALKNDWRTLSPDKPPLPSLFPGTDATIATPGAALAPMFEHRPFAFSPFTSNRKHQQRSTTPILFNPYSRPLDPILEETELSSSVKTSMENRTQATLSSTSQQHQSPSHSSLSEPQQPHSRYSNNSSSSSVVSCSSPPPTINTTWHHLQRQSSDEIQSPSSPLSPSPLGNELYCKRKFSKMVQATYRFQSKPNMPSAMLAVFKNDHVQGIRLISPNGQASDCTFTGNLQYIPPEMFVRASNSRGLSDVWVLGISLYRMLVGTYPFKASDDRSLVKKMLQSSFSIPGHLSEDAKDLLRRMLAPEQSRASLDLIMFHPWLKPYRVVVSSTSSPLASPNISLRINTKKRKPKWQSLIRKTCKLLFYGPYPPPSRPYRELAHLGR